MPDVGDGTYRNPVLYADYSDPDAIRVGEDYWLTASSFSHVPGLPILHSRDLVNWTLVNHALPALVPEMHFKTPRPGQGVWAPAFRYYAGKFWIFYGDPDFGLYVITADDPRGAWSEPVLLRGGKGLIDPCPLWDDDGQAYLIHGWAKSRSGICNLLTLHRMSPDGLSLLDDGVTLIDANQMPGWKTLEGPKLYKRDGWYWVSAPAGGVAEGYQAVFRSRHIYGPYESRVVLEQGGTPINGPHQGAWLDTPTGEYWFFHFQEIPALGRVVHLQPMRWTADGWPEMGRPLGGGRGEPVLCHAKPTAPVQKRRAPATSDGFAGGKPGLQWQWQGNPERGWVMPAGGDAGLRLACVPRPEGVSRWLAPALLLQKFPAPVFSATATVALTSEKLGDVAGLMVFGYDYAWLAVRRTAEGYQLVLSTCALAQKGGAESAQAEAPLQRSAVDLRVEMRDGARCQFSYREGAGEFRAIGAVFQASSSMWVGGKVGVFASSEPGVRGNGFAVVREFAVRA